MKQAYVPKLNPGEKHLHIKALMHQKLTHLMQTGTLKLAANPAPKFPKVTLKLKLKKGV